MTSFELGSVFFLLFFDFLINFLIFIYIFSKLYILLSIYIFGFYMLYSIHWHINLLNNHLFFISYINLCDIKNFFLRRRREEEKKKAFKPTSFTVSQSYYFIFLSKSFSVFCCLEIEEKIYNYNVGSFNFTHSSYLIIIFIIIYIIDFE